MWVDVMEIGSKLLSSSTPRYRTDTAYLTMVEEEKSLAFYMITNSRINITDCGSCLWPLTKYTHYIHCYHPRSKLLNGLRHSRIYRKWFRSSEKMSLWNAHGLLIYSIISLHNNTLSSSRGTSTGRLPCAF
jgi:hypothetical protein